MIEIVTYQPKYANAFKELNEAWIKEFFELEESDRKMLEDPQGYILEGGGTILFALLDQEPVGTCALIKTDEGVYELAKMAVSKKAQGLKIGWKIGQAILEEAKKRNAKKVYLETNSILKPAIGLYQKLGFKDICGYDSPYARCNVQMEVIL